MQMGYDFDDGRHSAQSGPGIGQFARFTPGWPDGQALPAEGRHPDWAGLRARFMAIHALHHTLAANADSLLPGGNFAAAGEAVLAACRQNPAGVNPVCSANGKVAAPIMSAVAVSPTPGDRGPQ